MGVHIEIENEDYYRQTYYFGDKIKSRLKSLIEKHKLEEVITITGLAPRCGVTFNGINDLDYLDIASVWNEIMLENGVLPIKEPMI
jgi:hypothetical protein